MEYPSPKKIFIGVSWPYTNGDIHLGHLAGQNVACDVFARYHRLKGHDVLMVSGSDSHGAPVIVKAEELGIEPAKLSQMYHEKIVKTFEKLGLVYELYTKTTTENHKIVVQNIFNVLNEFGYLKIKESKQYYDPKVKRFLPDRFVKGTCPNCKAENARGDECPECGAFLVPTDLINPYSILSDAKPILRKTKHFYMNLKKVEGEISKWVRNNNRRWRKWVREFTKGWIKQGLQSRPVTRDLSFGVPVPIKGWENKVIYVWIEAVVGYLSASIEWAQNQGDPGLWEEFWKNTDCEHYYFIAGGNVPYHTIMWPAEITAYNKKYGTEKENLFRLPGEISSNPLNLPYDVPANRMLFFKGKKMSKGDNTSITIETLLEKYNPDLIRYFFVRYGPENHDREYTWKDFIDANNNELVATIGNFINRSLTFLYTKFDGIVPEGTLDVFVKEKIEKTFEDVGTSIEKSEFIKAAEHILELGRFANKYFNDKQPWITLKTDKDIAENTIFNTIQLVNAFRKLLQPFTPFSVDKLNKILGIKEEYNPTSEVEAKGRVSKYVDQWHFTQIPSGHKINQPEILFEKLEYTDELKAVDGVLEIKKTQYTNTLEVSEDLKNIPLKFFIKTGLTISKSRKEIDEYIKKNLEQINPKLLVKIENGYIQQHDKFSKEKGLKSSAQELKESALKKKFPRINTLVDIYNSVSTKYGLSIGVHDLDKLIGNIRFNTIEEKTPFEGIGREENFVQAGEYAYIDDEGVVCKLDIKQCERTKVSTKTKNIFVIIQGNSKTAIKDLEIVETELKRAIEKYLVKS